MSFRLIIYIILLRKWFIIFPVIMVPLFTGLFLMKVEPVYLSEAKIWSKEKLEESKLLRVQRLGSQEDTYSNVQKNIITSNVVLESVVDELNLLTPPPSNSILTRILKPKPETAEEKIDEARARVEAVKALKGSIWVEAVNPEILRIDSRMNTPELAQKLAYSVIENYKKQYLKLLTREVNQYESFLADHIKQIRTTLKEHEAKLLEFEATHPELAVQNDMRLIPQKKVLQEVASKAKDPHNNLNKAPAEKFKSMLSHSPPLTFVKEISDVSPVPEIMKQLANLKMQRNAILYSAGKESRQLEALNLQISTTERLLNEHVSLLSKQSQAAIKHESILWEYSEARRNLVDTMSEYNKILLSRGTKLKQISNIIVLDPPSYDGEQIYPRKKATLMAGCFLGFLMGLALAYIAHLSDRTFHLPEELALFTNEVVLGSSLWSPPPKKKDTADAHSNG